VGRAYVAAERPDALAQARSSKQDRSGKAGSGLEPSTKRVAMASVNVQTEERLRQRSRSAKSGDRPTPREDLPP